MTVSREIDGDHRGDRRHHLPRLLLVEVEDAGEHVGLAGVELAAGLRLGDDPLELVGRAALRLGVGIGPQHPQHPVRGGIQRDDERVEDDPEELQRPGDPPGDALGVLDHVELRDHLADRGLRGRDQQIGNDHRDHHGRAVAERVAEQRLEHVGDRRLAQGSDADRGHRDPDLAGGDVVADVLALRQCEAGPAGALLGQRLEPGTAGADERVLRDDKERVDQHQQPAEDDEQRFHRRSESTAQPSISALLLRGGSSFITATSRTVAAGADPAAEFRLQVPWRHDSALQRQFDQADPFLVLR